MTLSRGSQLPYTRGENGNKQQLHCLVEVTPTRMVYSGAEYSMLPEYLNTQIPEWNILPKYLAHEGKTTLSLVFIGIPY